MDQAAAPGGLKSPIVPATAEENTPLVVRVGYRMPKGETEDN